MLNINGISWYEWAPVGFAHNYKFREWLCLSFLPLWLADRQYWHTDNDAWLKRFPRHDPKNIGEIERAWSHIPDSGAAK